MLNQSLGVLETPIDTFFFDCDSTLSLIEGVDVLANKYGVFEEVYAITKRCMSTTGLNVEAYRTRLDAIKPTLHQVLALSKDYIAQTTPGALETIALLQSLHKKIYILSAGLKPAVDAFAKTLNLTPEQVLAVDLYFDNQGNYLGFNETSNLVKSMGKVQEIQAHTTKTTRTLLIGDGMSDWEARESVSRFIGFAGLEARSWVKEHSLIFINSPSLFPMIPLCITKQEALQLAPQYYTYYEQGLKESNHVQYSSAG
jgi:phosphoserine phosphatase